MPEQKDKKGFSLFPLIGLIGDSRACSSEQHHATPSCRVAILPIWAETDLQAFTKVVNRLANIAKAFAIMTKQFRLSSETFRKTCQSFAQNAKRFTIPVIVET